MVIPDQPAAEVRVRSYEPKLLEEASVSLKPLRGSGEELRMEFSKAIRTYRVEGVAQGEYLLRVQAKGYEPQERSVTVGPGGLSEWSVLGKKGMPFFYRGRVPIPFEAQNLIGVSR